MAFSTGTPLLAFANMGRQYALYHSGAVGAASRTPPSSPKQGHWQKVAFSHSLDTDFFRRCLKSTDLTQLRQQLARDSLISGGVDDTRLFERIADLVGAGKLDLLERVGGATAVSGSSSGGRTSQPTPEYAPPPAAVCPADLVVNKPPQPMVAKPAATLDPQTQAKVLVEAAQQGVPFCELCARS